MCLPFFVQELRPELLLQQSGGRKTLFQAKLWNKPRGSPGEAGISHDLYENGASLGALVLIPAERP
jgi:hypothetical protein